MNLEHRYFFKWLVILGGLKCNSPSHATSAIKVDMMNSHARSVLVMKKKRPFRHWCYICLLTESILLHLPFEISGSSLAFCLHFLSRTVVSRSWWIYHLTFALQKFYKKNKINRPIRSLSVKPMNIHHTYDYPLHVTWRIHRKLILLWFIYSLRFQWMYWQ